jgi:excisionase family DNA binding protein
MSLVTIQDLAEKLRVRESWIRGQLFQRKIPFFKVGRHIRFDESVVRTWISLGCPANWRDIGARPYVPGHFTAQG